MTASLDQRRRASSSGSTRACTTCSATRPESACAMENFPAPFVTGADAGAHHARRSAGRCAAIRDRISSSARGARTAASSGRRPTGAPIYDKGGALPGHPHQHPRHHAAQGSRAAAGDHGGRAAAVADGAAGISRPRAGRARAALRAARRRWTSGILFVSNDNRVVYSNPAFNRIWPLPPAARIIGSTPEELVRRLRRRCSRGPSEQARHVLRAAARGAELAGALRDPDGRRAARDAAGPRGARTRTGGRSATCGCSRTSRTSARPPSSSSISPSATP